MAMNRKHGGLSRRGFFRLAAGSIAAPLLSPFLPRASGRTAGSPRPSSLSGATLNDLYWVRGIPDLPFSDPAHPNRHLGVDSLLYVMADNGLKLYRSGRSDALGGPSGLIARDDVVLIKVNAQWKYRGATNSDVIRGLVQRLLEHPDGFTGEIVIIENGQGRGSLNCDTSSTYGGDAGVHANANDEKHSFLYLVDSVFREPRVSAVLLDPFRATFIGETDHATNGYRRHGNVSYPCFTTPGGRRVELREGIWNGTTHVPGLKLINVPVLKHHDTGGSEFTASLKHFYGIVSMDDGQSGPRHYSALGETAGRMAASVVTPVLNIIDAIWVSQGTLGGWPESSTFRANQLLAGQDPVALDAWAARHILYPIDGNARHDPDFPGVDGWLSAARDTINGLGGLFSAEKGILVDRVTRSEAEMSLHECLAGRNIEAARLDLSDALVAVLASTADARELVRPLAVTVTGGRALSWQAAGDAGWFDVEPAAGTGNAVVSVRVRPAGLEPGRYTGSLVFHCAGAANSPQRLRVSLTVTEPRRENAGRRPRPKASF